MGSDTLLVCGDVEGEEMGDDAEGSISIKASVGVGGRRGGSDGAGESVETEEESTSKADSILGTGFRFGGLREARLLTRSEISGSEEGGAGGGLAG